jgi:Predicted nucleoside-diphosphate sugar epimerases
MNSLKDRRQLIVRQTFLIFVDILCITVAFYGAFALFSNHLIEPRYFTGVASFTLVTLIISSLGFFAFLKFYHSLWQFASLTELKNILFGTLLSTAANIIISMVANCLGPVSVYLIYFMILTLLIGASRISYRFIRLYHQKSLAIYRRHAKKNIMIVGAGEAGEKILREVTVSTHVNKAVKCFIDDDLNKKGTSIHGVPIVGNRYDILANVQKYGIDEIFVALPSVDDKEISAILNICKDTKCKLKRLPGIYQFINDEVILNKLKDVEVQDLLGRDPIKVNLNEIMSYVTNKVVMVTGGGGSIGSELCRQIAERGPRQLIIVDIYENNAYNIQLELKRKYPKLNLETMIASVRDANKVDDLFKVFHPDIVYHAAAHKHVPLMEDSPHESIKNNVFGTLNVVRACDKYYAKKFILISTDKAVNPTNIMGASKRLCEMIVQTYDKKSQTEYVAVRFGNVLGSNGSVIPLFKEQIKNGGPVTVTHPDIIRYFMTIPEAVSLVLQAGAYARGGEIFVLDMGEPVKILDMARNLIKLSGFEPDVDIKIEFTGLRPGEKLYEEMLMKEEGMRTTPNKLIHIGKPLEFDTEIFIKELAELYQIAYDEDSDIRQAVAKIVKTYHYETPRCVREDKLFFREEQEDILVTA